MEDTRRIEEAEEPLTIDLDGNKIGDGAAKAVKEALLLSSLGSVSTEGKSPLALMKDGATPDSSSTVFAQNLQHASSDPEKRLSLDQHSEQNAL